MLPFRVVSGNILHKNNFIYLTYSSCPQLYPPYCVHLILCSLHHFVNFWDFYSYHWSLACIYHCHDYWQTGNVGQRYEVVSRICCMSVCQSLWSADVRDHYLQFLYLYRTFPFQLLFHCFEYFVQVSWMRPHPRPSVGLPAGSGTKVVGSTLSFPFNFSFQALHEGSLTLARTSSGTASLHIVCLFALHAQKKLSMTFPYSALISVPPAFNILSNSKTSCRK